MATTMYSHTASRSRYQGQHAPVFHQTVHNIDPIAHRKQAWDVARIGVAERQANAFHSSLRRKHPNDKVYRDSVSASSVYKGKSRSTKEKIGNAAAIAGGALLIGTTLHAGLSKRGFSGGHLAATAASFGLATGGAAYGGHHHEQRRIATHTFIPSAIAGGKQGVHRINYGPAGRKRRG